ncbi:putative membrane attack complex component/perforin (MACPF) domain-containing protein [Helianthus annuus]|nr:putative membrane attack complex component/perforin (MACPF) domain-containing protein [Helianthus annuus]
MFNLLNPLDSGIFALQMSEQFNQELSLTGKIPSGHFNSMFKFSGNWQKDVSDTKTLAFEGMFISLYTIALEKSHILLCDHLKQVIPSSWEPALFARFIERFGTHVTVGVYMGGKDVIYIKQSYASSLQPVDVQKRLETMADKRFLDVDGHYDIGGQMLVHQVLILLRRCLNANVNLVCICKRRYGSDHRNLKHSEWLHNVQLEPDVIKMSFIPITLLLNGVPGSGYLCHAIISIYAVSWTTLTQSYLSLIPFINRVFVGWVP